MKSVHCTLDANPHDESAKEFLEKCVDGLQKLHANIGGHDFWMNDDGHVSERRLKLIQQKFHDSESFIFDHRISNCIQHAEGIFDVFSGVIVRVLSVSNLPKYWGGLDRVDPLVKVSCGTSQRETPKVRNESNPVWQEKNEFYFVPPLDDRMIYIEIQHGEKVGGYVGSEESLGDPIDFNIGDLPLGEWVLLKLPYHVKGSNRKRDLGMKKSALAEVQLSVYRHSEVSFWPPARKQGVMSHSSDQLMMDNYSQVKEAFDAEEKHNEKSFFHRTRNANVDGRIERILDEHSPKNTSMQSEISSGFADSMDSMSSSKSTSNKKRRDWM